VGIPRLEFWPLLAKVSLNDLFSFIFLSKIAIGLSAKGNQLYLIQTDVANTSRLVAVDLQDLSLTTLGVIQADICDVLIDPQTKSPLALCFKL